MVRHNGASTRNKYETQDGARITVYRNRDDRPHQVVTPAGLNGREHTTARIPDQRDKIRSAGPAAIALTAAVRYRVDVDNSLVTTQELSTLSPAAHAPERVADPELELLERVLAGLRRLSDTLPASVDPDLTQPVGLGEAAVVDLSQAGAARVMAAMEQAAFAAPTRAA